MNDRSTVIHRNSVRLEEYQVPAGTIAVTFDIEGAKPCTLDLKVEQMEDCLGDAARACANQSVDTVIASIARHLPRMIEDPHSFAPVQFAKVLSCGLWAVFNREPAGDTFRAAVAAEIRVRGKAHITWFCCSDGFATAVGTHYVDLWDYHVRSRASGKLVVIDNSEDDPSPSPVLH